MQNGNHRQEPMPVSFEECNLLAGRVVAILHGLTRTSVKVVTDNERRSASVVPRSASNR